MHSFDVTSLLVLGFFLAIGIALFFMNREIAKNDILKYLTAKGATKIKLDNNILDNDRDTMTFYVDYTDRKGNRQFTSCKVRTGFLSSGELFWSEATESDAESDDPQADRTGYEQLSEKIRSHSAIELPTYRIAKVLSIMGSKDQIVLLDYSEPFQNLLRCHADGEIVWQAELLNTANDVYTDVEWREGELTAINKSNIMVTLVLKTGKIAEME